MVDLLGLKKVGLKVVQKVYLMVELKVNHLVGLMVV